MAVTQVDISITRYMTVPVTVSCWLPDRTPLSLVGTSLTWTVRNSSGGTLLTKTSGAGTITIAANSFSFTLSAAETLLLPYGDLGTAAKHEAKVLTLAGQVFPVMRGRIRADDSYILAMP